MDFRKYNYNKYLVVVIDENKLSCLVIMAYRKILLFFIYFILNFLFPLIWACLLLLTFFSVAYSIGLEKTSSPFQFFLPLLIYLHSYVFSLKVKITI